MITYREEQVWIDTYPEAMREELPIFAENRIHQRTSGNPYPNKVVLVAQRDVKEAKEYTCIVLENEYLEIGILPALGGKIWYARDKKKDYGFFYKNNVIKPALIGVLGSWTSGGLEFNWPFHHRASTFMPVDYYIERTEDAVTVWLSEHDPINRMKGMVGVSLREGECIFDTKVKLDNITPFRHSFLWWENAAVPADENYRIFFPPDVNYVHFHYKRSVTTYPIANNDRFGAFNGIYYDGDTDISAHKNTRQATSYFSAESKYDYFGGYDEKKRAGVVHVADRQVSPGKKMFTWAYSQLAKTWENALTDNDGQYAELMAGCYSDNQPDLTWLMPYETKIFSQKWFPIHDKGIPVYANDNGALFLNGTVLSFQSVRPVDGARVSVYKDDTLIMSHTLDVPSYETVDLSDEFADGLRIVIENGYEAIVTYDFKKEEEREIPEPRRELPYHREKRSAEDLYLEGLHIEQYRSPEYSAEHCYLEALERESDYAPALVALAELCLKKHAASRALSYVVCAEKSITRFNTRTESGRLYYLKGLALCALSRFEEGYDYFGKAAWCYDYRSAATLHMGLIDIRKRAYSCAVSHFTESLQGNGESVIARVMLAYTHVLLGERERGEQLVSIALEKDRLNLFAYAFLAVIRGEYKKFYEYLKSDAAEVSLDIIELLAEAGLYREILDWLNAAKKVRSLGTTENYIAAWLSGEKVKKCEVGIAYPSRSIEKTALEKCIEQNHDDAYALYLYGTLSYGKGLYDEGINAWERATAIADDYRIYRNLAIACYSRYHDKERAISYMMKSVSLAPVREKQITFECAHLLAKVGTEGYDIVDFILSRDHDRDDIVVELARAYNHAKMPDEALRVLLERRFVACEGGEHAIADQYTYAHYLKGKNAYLCGDYEQALYYFENGQILPQSLGSGFWNPIKKVPLQYFAARCLEKLGRREDALEIYRSFIHFRFDYFTDMYLYTFAYYAARAMCALGKTEQADILITERKVAYEKAIREQTLGYFGTTPFFISFIDDAKEARKKHYAYPLYLFSRYLGIDAKEYEGIINENKYDMLIDDFTI